MMESDILSQEPVKPSTASDALGIALDDIGIKSFIHRLDFIPSCGLQVATGPATFFFIINGQCWLEPEAEANSLCLCAGDLALLMHNRGYILRDQPQSPVIPVEDILLPSAAPSRAGQSNSSECLTRLLCGVLLFDNEQGSNILSALPPVIHMKNGDSHLEPWLCNTLRFIAGQSDKENVEAQTLIDNLGQMIFTRAVRARLASLPKCNSGCLTAFEDPQIGIVLGQMHERPGEHWTVSSLARQAGMSRSACAAKFTSLVGQSPMQYLVKCRIQKACHLLKGTQNSIKQIARSIGYHSTSAFNNAFKRITGFSPGFYRNSER